MKTKKGFVLRNVCGENIIVAEGKENIDFTKIISMNETAAYLWKNVEGKIFLGKELQRQIPDISQKSLTQTLRILEEDGFVSREVFPEVPPRVEYSLTPRALSFLPLVDNIMNWAKENMEEIIADRANSHLHPSST